MCTESLHLSFSSLHLSCSSLHLSPSSLHLSCSSLHLSPSSSHLSADEAEAPKSDHGQLQRGGQRQAALVGDDVDQRDVEPAATQRLKQVVVAQQILTDESDRCQK